MNNLLIYIVLLIFAIIFVTKVYIINNEKLEHLTPQSDEAIQNIASLYNKDQLTIGSLSVTGKATAENVVAEDITSGNITSGNITSGKTVIGGGGVNVDGTKITPAVLSSTGRLHISGNELLYLLNKDGVVIGREWGGNGNLYVQGGSSIAGDLGLGGRLVRRYPGTYASDGWDIWNGGSGGFDDCINKCRGYGNATTAMHRNSDNYCWCKSIAALHPSQDGNLHSRHNTAFFI